MRRLPRWWTVAMASVLATFLAVSSAWAQTVVFTVPAPATTTAAGLVSDPDNQLYWLAQPAVDQTAGGPTTTVLGVSGGDSVVARLTIAAAVDVAAIAWHGKSLYLADIADPDLSRDTVTVYGVPAAAVVGDKEVPYATYPLAYPDGPHDAAALLMRPDGRIFLITLDGRMYEAPATLNPGETTTLAYVGSTPTDITAGLFLDTDLLAVRTDTALLLLDANTRTVTERVSLDSPGRGLTLDLSGAQVLTVTGADSGVTVASVPIPGRSPPPTAGPTGQSAVESRRGTLVMILAAGILAVVGGILAFLRR